MTVYTDSHTNPPLGIEGFGERLVIVMREESVSSFAKRCGLSSETIKKYRNGKIIPGADKVLAISRSTGVSLSWLITGEGTPQPGLFSEEEVTRWWMNIAELLTFEQKCQIISDFHRHGVEGVFKRLPVVKNGLAGWVK
ncbi:helix-turn-helix domain-containing protein [Erwinia rhapontici]|uniref:helix-turn-helix domain-containing protein n=1 Tax=Erwinia rhapontici TaxID=55212 RepID=UPI00216A54E5|nr:helix-turn-helix domain-containing protein [Erwinia rhapontici]MCS3608479.1 transcriptional regulator with XRE-family HTH domain [Erwinia rhapontici]